jgi:hypothetical protein
MQLLCALILGLSIGVSYALGMNQGSPWLQIWTGGLISAIAAIALFAFMRLFSHRIEVLRSRENELRG